MEGVAIAYMGWSPSEFWSATLYDYLLAVQAFTDKNKALSGDAMTDDKVKSLKKMMKDAENGH